MMTPIVTLGYGKVGTMIGLGTMFLLATEIGDPTVERYVSLGVGGILAATIFYFYRQLAAQALEREKQNADAHQAQTTVILGVVQDNTRAVAGLEATVASFHTTVDTMNREQRERYEQTLRMEGRKGQPS